MSHVRRNIIANYLGQVWTSAMGLAFIPLYIRYLGIEAYGLIGLFSVMQAWLSLLDMGMTPTLNREMARFTSGGHSIQSIRDLLRSLELVCFSLAGLIALGVWAGSGYLASSWLKAGQLPPAAVAQALSVMAFVVALRFVEGIYRGSLFGLQKQVWFNGASAILATLRHGGALAVLVWVLPSVQAFFLWQAFISLLTILVFAACVHRTLPKPPLPARFSREAIGEVGKFARGMLGITFLSILLTQIDKVILSRLLPLESFGYYTLAATVAGVLFMMVGPIIQAIYPRMVELLTLNDLDGVVQVYHRGAQLITVLTAPLVMLLVFFAQGIVFMWSGNASLAEHTTPILSVMALGTFLNGVMNMPYQLQVAHGWTRLTLKVNLGAVVVLIPAIFWVVPHYGALGAAWIWLSLNAVCVPVAVFFMHRRLIAQEQWRWYLADILLPLGGSVSVLLIARFFQPAAQQGRWHWFFFLAGSGGLALAASSALAGQLRPRLLAALRGWLGGGSYKQRDAVQKLS